MTQKYRLITSTPTGNNIQYFSDIRDWFIASMTHDLKVNTSLGYLRLIEESDKAITLNLHDMASNELILTVYQCSDITKDHVIVNTLYYLDVPENQIEIEDDFRQLWELIKWYDLKICEINIEDIVGRYGMTLKELKEHYLLYSIGMDIFTYNSYDSLIDDFRVYFN